MRILNLLVSALLILNSTIIIAQNKDIPDNVRAEITKRMLSNDQIINNLLGHELPNFNLILLDGTTLNSNSLKGKPTIINFWFVYCAPCIEEMPILNQIKNDFGDKVNFIAITYHNQK